MSDAAHPVNLVRFGIFEADLHAGELRKNGRKVRIQDLPFRLLEVLLEHPGEVVTREELQRGLWPSDTFVEFEHSLNAAVAKLRSTLGDSADSPRFIETIPRRGYRFLADLETIGGVSTPSGSNNKPGRRGVAVAGVAVLAAGLIWILTGQPPKATDTPLAPVPLTAYPGSESEPSFSPDGSTVAFVWDGEGGKNTDIYMLTIGAEEPVRLTEDPAEDVSPAWSPDGRNIAFVRRFPEQERVEYRLATPTASDRSKKLLDGPHLSHHPRPWLAWHPDGKWLAVIDSGASAEEYALSLVSIETARKRSLPSPPKPFRIGAPAFSPDGRSLVFWDRSQPYLDESYLLALSAQLEPQGDPQLLHSRHGWSHNPVFTADGGSIVFAARAPHAGLWRLRLSEPDNPRRLDFAGDAISLAISPRTNRMVLAQQRERTDIWRLELSSPGVASGTTRFISSTHLDHSPAYSADGRIVFGSNRSGTHEIYTCDGNGDHVKKLTSMGASMTGWPHWSPTGKQIVFDSNKDGKWDVYVVDSNVIGPPRPLTHHPEMDGVASWSHDGQWIYFGSYRSGNTQIWKKPVGGGVAIPVTKHGGYIPFESPDGKSVYYLKRKRWEKSGNPGDLWKVPVQGGEEELVLKQVDLFHYCVGRDGIYFVVPPEAGGKRTIQFLDFSSGVTQIVTELEKPLHSGISVSPDGRYLLYTQVEEHSSDLMLVENFR